MWLCNKKKGWYLPQIHQVLGGPYTIVSKLSDLVYKIKKTHRGTSRSCTIIFWKYIMENIIFISHYQTTADETTGQTIELMQYSTLYLILPFIYTVTYSHHRNSSYLCRIDGCTTFYTSTHGHSWKGTGRTSTVLQRRVRTAGT